MIGTQILKIDSEIAEILEVKDGTRPALHLEIDFLLYFDRVEADKIAKAKWVQFCGTSCTIHYYVSC